MKKIFEPLKLGNIQLSNKLVMAPMTRNRATTEGCATALMAEYYAQRASAGLIISEGIQPSVVGQGFMNTPGLHTAEQTESWKQVTEAVHNAGGHIFAQVMHSGRIGHPSLYPSAHQSIAPSAIAAKGQTFTPNGLADYPVPREMTLEDIKDTVQDFVSACKNAIAAGFDGVELHAGNGFLLHQFMADNTNKRSDEYGGSFENRVRFVVEVVNAVVAAIGAEKTAIRISPENPYNDMVETEAKTLYRTLIDQLPTNLAYVHIMEAGNRGQSLAVRDAWRGTFILNPHKSPDDGFVKPDIAEAVLENNEADAVALGALFLANPDLIERIKQGGPYNSMDEATLYGGDHQGYTDYPTLSRK
ncbi:alkene reductase [Paraneptunicella aestuarii]|uniref:alkene reductase n=1 Tax=Paraneptunicella aestuarii TaxID=2831148 RepID=UPI001E5251D1|nr:alkene reductase [Paraneptunicella aestuarii]UAA39914.1 alkene reductase [Paraneptunicella aestuarii]